MSRSFVKLPLVSIVIPVYNGSNYLAQAIDSALGQDYPNIEIIVVNDGSCDDGATERIAKGYGDRIRYLSKDNGGVATALNLGIQEMKGEYFSWLSHDDIYEKRKISSQIRTLGKMEDKTTIIAGGYLLFTDENGIIGARNFRKMYSIKQLSKPLFPVFHCAVNGCTLLIHKNHFDRVGLFDPALPTTQDYDLWFRMMRGQRIVYSRGLYVRSRVHENQGSLVMEANHQKECNDMWIGFLQQLADAEKAELSGSNSAFYREVYVFFKNHTSYDDVVKYSKMCFASAGDAKIDLDQGPTSKFNKSNKRKLVVLFNLVRSSGWKVTFIIYRQSIIRFYLKNIKKLCKNH